MATRKATSEKPRNKKEFIQSFGPEASAEEVVAKGKAAGLHFTKKYVWTKQSELRNGKGRKASAKRAAPAESRARARKKPGRRKSKQSAVTGESATRANGRAARAANGDAAHRMKALILELGTVRAEQIYRDVRSQLDALISR